MDKRAFIVALTGMICVTSVVVSILNPQQEQPATAKLVPTATPAKIIVKHAAAAKPSGYMSEEQCARIPDGMPVSDLVFKYGWPAGRYGYGYGHLHYPARPSGEDNCSVELNQDDTRVVSTIYRIY
jgi:hypothetical protein